MNNMKSKTFSFEYVIKGLGTAGCSGFPQPNHVLIECIWFRQQVTLFSNDLAKKNFIPLTLGRDFSYTLSF